MIPTSILFSIPHLVLKLAQQMVEKLADAYNGCQRTKHAHAAAHDATAYAVYPGDLPVLYNSVTAWWQYVAVTNGSMCNGEFL